MRSGVEAAVEALYEVFARYPLIESVAYCDHCVGPEQVVDLHRTPLRHLTDEQLGPLLSKSMTTWGDQRYLNHFLPRLLELVASGEMNQWSYPSFLPHRIGGPWRSGADDERRAIGDFAAAWWKQTTSTYPGPCEPSEVLDTIADCGQSVAPYLFGWPAVAGEPAARQLAALVQDLLGSARRASDFWREVDQWLAGPMPTDILAAAVVATGSPDVAQELSDVYEHLACWREWRAVTPDER
ncbi:hypothetical protein GCM10027280_41330 [Micromonospora polyrhachis]|uniref:Uncharacterized protein n=1 Tax=Micromonospora polyrhachis TaxID=1282883 RepID=A0A7W7SLU6_9ACTN|nr:hypothetical protein [Micromonospora polyrhachis]MBB4956831.1 hypothetical protein [Micromonospora polyrhachis]